ncbi:MAG TPA: DUF6186 family protein [Acidimicrobiales bacterium]|nr:DUF6186 family protein [Acidimicrobiales bacterium]
MTRTAFLVAWAIAALLLVGLEIRSLTTRGRYPGFGQLLRAATRRNIGMVVILVAWMWLGWHTFAR